MNQQDWSREVLEANRRLEGIVTSAMDAIITIDEQQHIILFNPAAEEMFGVSSNEAQSFFSSVSLRLPRATPAAMAKEASAAS